MAEMNRLADRFQQIESAKKMPCFGWPNTALMSIRWSAVLWSAIFHYMSPALRTPTVWVPYQSALQNDPEFWSGALHGVPLQKAWSWRIADNSSLH